MQTPRPPAHPLPPSGVSAAELLASCAAASAVSTPPTRHKGKAPDHAEHEQRPPHAAGDAGGDDDAREEDEDQDG
jgi:hypothetical protein